jgi:hypothetical protein
MACCGRASSPVPVGVRWLQKLGPSVSRHRLTVYKSVSVHVDMLASRVSDVWTTECVFADVSGLCILPHDSNCSEYHQDDVEPQLDQRHRWSVGR